MKFRLVRVLCGIMAAQLALAHGTVLVSAEEVVEQSYQETGQNAAVPLSETSNESGGEEEAPKEEADGEEDNTHESMEKTSSLTVNLNHGSVMDREQNFRVSLQGTSYEEQITLNPQEEMTEGSVTFEYISDGTDAIW